MDVPVAQLRLQLQGWGLTADGGVTVTPDVILLGSATYHPATPVTIHVPPEADVGAVRGDVGATCSHTRSLAALLHETLPAAPTSRTPAACRGRVLRAL